MMTGRQFFGKSGGRGRFGSGWEIYYDRRGKIPRCQKCLLGSGTSGPVVRIRVVGHVGGDD